MEGRSIGLDVHRDFCEVAICDGGKVRRAPRVVAQPEPLKQFARTYSGRTSASRWRRPATRWRSRGSSARTSTRS